METEESGRKDGVCPIINGLLSIDGPPSISSPFQHQFTAPELEPREFHLLDETHSDDSEDGHCSSGDSELPEDELEAMLEEDLPDEFKGTRRKRRREEHENDKEKEEDYEYEEKNKVVLVERGRPLVEVLPEGWILITHFSGMPVYLHKASRVCTLSRPYFLGSGSARKHDVPVSAIPCLQYLRDTEELEKRGGREVGQKLCAQCTERGPDESCPCNKKIGPVTEGTTLTVKDPSVTWEELYEYCKKRFEFKTMKFLRFKSWSERRKFIKLKKKQRQRPQMPEKTKLLSFPITSNKFRNIGDESSSTTREWVLNPSGKSYVCILHEYLQHVLKEQPTYQFQELENAATPFGATVLINDIKYGSGYGSSKKQAKTEAAKATLNIFIPVVIQELEGSKEPKKDAEDMSFFDEVRIEDPRVGDMCNKASEPAPYTILLTCLQRNFGMDGTQVQARLHNNKHQRNEFEMTVGKHSVTVPCRNKKDGKHLAAQALLQRLHPHVSSWGSLLRLYGSHSAKSLKRKKQEEQEITLLQSKAAINSPNFAILNKLKKEMLRIQELKNMVQPIGIFTPPEDTALPTSSGVNLNTVDL